MGEPGGARVVVVGGGITGLSAAHRLRGAGLPVTLLEGSDRLGGKIVTVREDGFVVEGGPDIFLGSKPWGVALCRELGLEDRLQGTRQDTRKTFILRRGRLYPLPEGLTGLVPSRFGPFLRTSLISPLGKLRMGLEYFLPAKTAGGDESLERFITRRLGRELYGSLVEPLLSGIYAGDGAQLSLAATFPHLRQQELEHGGLVRAALATRRAARRASAAGRAASPTAVADSRAGFLALPTGVQEIVEALAARLAGAEVRTNARVRRIDRADPAGFTVEVEGAAPVHADALVVATPAPATARLVEGLDPQLAALLDTIPYTSTATVSVAYRESDLPRRLDGHGYVVPRAEQRDVIACTWASSKLHGRVPEGWALLRAFIGRAGREEAVALGDEALLDLVRRELRSVMGIEAAPGRAWIYRWVGSMPQYTVGHVERLAELDRRLRELPGLALAGSAYRGVGIPDCVRSGEEAARKVLTELGMQPSGRGA